MQQPNKLFILSVCLLLAACSGGDVTETLGLNRQPPDEFQVLSRPPLSVPPEFNLRAPTELGEDTGLTAPASRQAEQVMFGEGASESGASFGLGLPSSSSETAVMSVLSSDTASVSDQNFLDLAGANVAKTDIRRLIRQENGEFGFEEEKSVLEQLREPTKREPLVDAAKEAERIKQANEQGESITDGEVETKLPKDRGVLDKINKIF